MIHLATPNDAFSRAQAELAAALDSAARQPAGFQPLSLLLVNANGWLIAAVVTATTRHFEADERWLE